MHALHEIGDTINIFNSDGCLTNAIFESKSHALKRERERERDKCMNTDVNFMKIQMNKQNKDKTANEMIENSNKVSECLRRPIPINIAKHAPKFYTFKLLIMPRVSVISHNCVNLTPF